MITTSVMSYLIWLYVGFATGHPRLNINSGSATVVFAITLKDLSLPLRQESTSPPRFMAKGGLCLLSQTWKDQAWKKSEKGDATHTVWMGLGGTADI